MDTLTVKSLQIHGRHGVHEEERRTGNLFEIDLILTGDFRKAAHKDALQYAVDYKNLEEIVAEVINGKSRQLIETLCFEIGEKLMKRVTLVETAEVALRKLSPPLGHPTAHTEIRMRWER